MQPTVLIAIGIQEGANVRDDTRSQCTTKNSNNCRKYDQDWQLQQPLYVEEPQYVEINPDFVIDQSGGRTGNGDPYILSRGKKIFGIKDAEINKVLEDEELRDYFLSRSEGPRKHRVRRSAEMDEESRDDATDGKNDPEEETNGYNPFRDVDEDKTAVIKVENRDDKFFKIERPNGVFKRYGKDEASNLAKVMPAREFAKQNRTFTNGVRIKNLIEEEHKMRLEDIPNNNNNGNDSEEIANAGERLNKGHLATSKGSERLALLGEKKFIVARKKRGNDGTGWRNADSGENVEKEETAEFEQMKSNVYIDKLSNLGTYNDPFIPSRGKKPFDDGAESSNEESANFRDGSIGRRRWKNSLTVKHYTHRKRSGSEEEARKNEENEESGVDEKSDVEIAANVRSTDKAGHSKSSGMKTRSRYRKKRNAYETRVEFQQDQWLRNIAKQAADLSYLKPRDKHGKIVDLLNRPADPYFIIRGKKASRVFEDDLRSSMEPRNEMESVARDVAGVPINLPTQKNLLRMLLTEKMSSCNYDINANQFTTSKQAPRDRRGSLDKILNLENLKYDPFYVVRGKRTSQDNFQINGGSEERN